VKNFHSSSCVITPRRRYAKYVQVFRLKHGNHYLKISIDFDLALHRLQFPPHPKTCVEIQSDLRHIVNIDYGFQLESFSIFHKSLAISGDKVEISANNPNHRPWRFQQK
jgi:hypothetical protein